MAGKKTAGQTAETSADKKKDNEIAKLKKIIADKNMEIETLTKISKTIVSGKYLEEILHLVATLTAQMTDSKICSIMLVDEEKQELKIIATQSLSKEYRDKNPLKVGEGISGYAVQTKKPIAVYDIQSEPRYFYKEIMKKEGMKSMLAVPMEVRGKVIGVIDVYTVVKHKYTADEISILSAVANQAAISIDNMNLKEEALMAKEALETRKLIERAKGVLMKNGKLTEDQAHKAIHKKSMDSRKSMKEIAEAILLASEMQK